MFWRAKATGVISVFGARFWLIARVKTHVTLVVALDALNY